MIDLKRHKFFISIFLLSIPAIYFLILPGFYESSDLHHLADIYEMFRATSSGQIPPRWGPDFSFGYGYPLFNFYYVLPFYLGALFFAVLKSLQFSFELIFIVSVLLSVFGMYLFLREFFNTWAAMAGSILFLYTPYRAVQIYVRGAMGEALALSFLPFVFWATFRLLKKFHWNFVVILACILALLILSHNYFWALTLPFLIFFVFIFMNKKDVKVSLISFAISLFLGLGLTSYWWLPAIIEQRLLSSKTPFPLYDHFPFLRQLILPSWGYGASVWGPQDGLSFQVGVMNWLVFLLFCVLFLVKMSKKENKHIALFIFSLSGFILSIFFMNIRSYPIWRLIPFHDFVQFPWRLLSFTTFFTSVMAAILVESFKSAWKLACVIIIFGSISLTLNYFRPSQIFYKGDDEYLARLFANRSLGGEKKEVSQEYLNWSEDYLLLPHWVGERPKGLPSAKIESKKASIESIQEISAVKYKVEIFSQEDTILTFNNYYFPGWFAMLDGKNKEIKIGRPYGQIEVNVPPGRHSIVFYWAETNLRRFADLVSFLSFFFLLMVLKTKGKCLKLLIK